MKIIIKIEDFPLVTYNFCVLHPASLVATRGITSISEMEALLMLVSSFFVSLPLGLLPGSQDLSEAFDAVKAFRLASRASFSLSNPLYPATRSGSSPKIVTY